MIDTLRKNLIKGKLKYIHKGETLIISPNTFVLLILVNSFISCTNLLAIIKPKHLRRPLVAGCSMGHKFVYRQTFYGWIPAVAEDYMIKIDTNNTLVECCTEMLPFNIGVNIIYYNIIRTVKIQIFTVYTSVELLKICIYMRA